MTEQHSARRVVRTSDAVDLAHEALQTANQALAIVKGHDGKLDRILDALGEEREDGVGGFISTGLTGRVRRNEATIDKVKSKYQNMLSAVGGFTVAFSLMGGAVAALWVLLQPHIHLVIQ